MASIRVAIDNIQGKSSDKKTLETFAEKLRSAGHNVSTHGVGPNKIQQTMLKSNNSCDVMIQIAGGKCLGTLVDFYKGLGSYYHAKAGGFAYFKCWDPDWKAVRAHDDGFSSESSLKPYKGKTLPEIYKKMSENKKMCYGYGTTAEECAKTWINSYGGKTASSNSENTGEGGGTNLLEMIKQAWSDLDPYGIELTLTGDTLNVKRTNPNTAKPLTESQIINNTVTIQDYDSNTPNSYNGYKDQYLINRFGEIELEGVNSSWKDQVLLVGQRGHGHSIDLKCLLSNEYTVGKWVSLTLPGLEIKDRKYIITKSTYDEEMVLGITLEPAPPSIYVEIQEEDTEETGSSEDEEE